MKKGELPDWLYNALPYLYAIIGLFSIIEMRNWMAVFSGVTLLSSAGIVWLLRSRYGPSWQQHDRFQKTPGNGPKSNTSDNSFVEILWRSSFDCGHPVIDAQHRRLFELGNELLNAGLNANTKAQLVQLLEELIHHISEHFRIEQVLLAKLGHPVSKEQQEIHQTLVAKATNLCNRFRGAEIAFSEIAGFIVYDLVVNHVTRESLKSI